MTGFGGSVQAMIASLRNNARSRDTIFHNKTLTLGKSVFKLKKHTVRERWEAQGRVEAAKRNERWATLVAVLTLALLALLIYLFFTL